MDHLRSLAAAAATAVALAAGAAEAPRELAVCADPSNLPFSNQRQEGFENRIAALVAQDLHATLRYAWSSQRRSFLRKTLFTGDCDVVVGLPVGLERVATTGPVYESSYVFVSRRSLPPLQGLDDPRLHTLKIGVQAVSVEGYNPPPVAALARRGIHDNVVGYPMWGPEEDESPPSHLIDAVAQGDVDVAIVWGPFAGWFARRHGDALVLHPVASDPLQPDLAFRYPMALAVRRGDDALRTELQGVLDRRRTEIDAILDDYGVPRPPR